MKGDNRRHPEYPWVQLPVDLADVDGEGWPIHPDHPWNRRPVESERTMSMDRLGALRFPAEGEIWELHAGAERLEVESIHVFHPAVIERGEAWPESMEAGVRRHAPCLVRLRDGAMRGCALDTPVTMRPTDRVRRPEERERLAQVHGQPREWFEA